MSRDSGLLCSWIAALALACGSSSADHPASSDAPVLQPPAAPASGAPGAGNGASAPAAAASAPPATASASPLTTEAPLQPAQLATATPPAAADGAMTPPGPMTAPDAPRPPAAGATCNVSGAATASTP